MNLTDAEILELNILCGAVVDGTLTDAQRERLSEWLRGSEDARTFYVRALAQSASLHTYAAEMQSEPGNRMDRPARPAVIYWIFGSLAAAAVLAFGLWVTTNSRATAEAARKTEYVARLTGTKGSEWARHAQPLATGDRLQRGQRLDLAKGRAEIMFDSGARVVLEGPASLDLNSAWDSTLRRGTITAMVPPEAIGFRISNRSVEVVDLGTEFTMIAEASGAAEVLVLKGEVEAAPRDGSDPDSILLKQNESRRFAQTGVSVVGDSAEKIAHFNQPIDFDRFAQPTHYIHWSFDENAGDRVAADSLGQRRGTFDLKLEQPLAGNFSAVHVAGHNGKALAFDGHLVARAPFPGLSGTTPHTVAFWVQVPVDAQLSDAMAMVAWGTSLKKLSARPVHINWNRSPNEGPLGALRTDFGGGSAMGMTSLRDGRWHHVAVVFVPGADDTLPPQVRQYIDGRLESSTIVPGKVRGPAVSENSLVTDTLWLGCRLGPSGPRLDRFRGQLDELFIADRALEPNEIVNLMKENRPLPADAVARLP